VSYPTNSVEYQAAPTSETCGFDELSPDSATTRSQAATGEDDIDVLVVGGGIAGV